MIRMSRRTVTAAALAGAAALGGCTRPDLEPEVGPHCFGAEPHNGRLDGLRVFQQAFPPLDNGPSRDYPYWPCTDAATAQDFGRSSWTGGNIWAFLWANRCNEANVWNAKPNPLAFPRERVGELECRSVFTSHAKANAATRCQIRFMLGMEPGDYREPWLRLDGTSSADFIADADFRARPGTYCRTNNTWEGETYRVMTDKVLLPGSRLTDGANAGNRVGVVLDYEVQDSRSPEVTEAFLHALAHDFEGTGKKLALLTNPLNAPTQQHTGCTPENIPRIFADVDYLTIFLWSGNPERSIPASYAAQVAMLGPLADADYDKVIVDFELGEPGPTLDDAAWLHRTLHGPGNHPDKVMFWRNYASQGGDCDTDVNQKISTVCFGS